jgi:hypothetical protein
MIDEDIYDSAGNPLDCVEEVLSAHEWVFSRTDADELVVDVTGQNGTYRILFVWQEEFCAMQMVCQYDMAVNRKNLSRLPETLMHINSKLWLGHFGIEPHTRHPIFRHNALFRGLPQSAGTEQVEELVDIALMECERFYPAFDMLAGKDCPDGKAMSLALLNTEGEA